MPAVTEYFESVVPAWAVPLIEAIEATKATSKEINTALEAGAKFYVTFPDDDIAYLFTVRSGDLYATAINGAASQIFVEPGHARAASYGSAANGNHQFAGELRVVGARYRIEGLAEGQRYHVRVAYNNFIAAATALALRATSPTITRPWCPRTIVSLLASLETRSPCPDMSECPAMVRQWLSETMSSL